MRIKFVTSLALLACVSLATSIQAQPFFYVGAPGGDFFDEANWNDQADGLGSALGGDPIIDSTTNAIAIDLVIDGDSVVAAGQVDFGTGSLTLTAGSTFDITGAGNDLDINATSTFSLTDAAVTVNDIINFEGTSSFSGGSVESTTDDIAFQDNFVNLSIDGTTFTSLDNTYFDGFVGSIANASFTSGDRLGLRNSVAIVMTDVDIDVAGGTGDIDDVFAAAGSGASLTILGASTLLADSVEEGADLILGGTTVATLGGGGVRIAADGSTITVNTLGVSLVVGVLDEFDIDYEDARPFLINAGTGLSYAQDDSTWNIQGWDGNDAVTLSLTSLVPEPSSLAMASICFVAAVVRRRRHLGGQ